MKTFAVLLVAGVTLLPAAFAAPAASAPEPLVATAKSAKTEYCFAVVRKLQPEKSPPPTLVLRVQFDVTYRNTSARPVILPWQYERTVYTALTPGVMKPTREHISLLGPSVLMMMRLPANVNPDNPVNPPNDEFRVIPAGGEINLPLLEQITIPVHKDTRPKIDLRGKPLYVRLKLHQRPLAPNLEAQLSDKWTSFGVPWTGDILTNTILFNVPATTAAADCVDTRNPNEGKDVDKSLKLQR